jgi:hypothetical protein
MKKLFPSVERIGIIAGLFTALAQVVYFLIMKNLGYAEMLELRFFNFVILAVGICTAISRYKHLRQSEEFYLKGWAEGIFTAAVSTVVFGIFMAVYLQYFDRELLMYIRQNAAIGMTTNGLFVFFDIIMEGMAGGFVITLSAMQFFKVDGSHKRSPSTPGGVD